MLKEIIKSRLTIEIELTALEGVNGLFDCNWAHQAWIGAEKMWL